MRAHFLIIHCRLFWLYSHEMEGLLRWLSGKESACQCRRCRFEPWVGKIPWSRELQPTPVLLPGEFHGQRILVGCSSQGHKESDMTEVIKHGMRRKKARSSPGPLLLGYQFHSWGLYPHYLITSQRAHFLMPSHWGLEFQHKNFEETQTFNS